MMGHRIFKLGKLCLMMARMLFELFLFLMANSRLMASVREGKVS